MKEKTIFKNIMCVMTVLLLVASVALSSVTLYGQTKVKSMVEQQMGAVEDVNQEDDVTIAREYIIKSTLQISNAYLSGDKSKLNDVDKETFDMAKQIIDEYIKEDMNDYEKEKAIYEYLTSKLKANTGILTVIPNNSQSYDNPHDVLKYRSAVCVGYATTFRMFMQMLNIECKIVHSTDLTHSWNLVKLGDDWYHVDCYNDSEGATYLNFNMDDQRCSEAHDWTREYYPSANGKKYNYIFSICEELDSIYDIPKWVVNAFKSKKSVISTTFKEPITDKNEQAAEYMASKIVDRINESEDLFAEREWLKNYEGQYVLVFRLTNYSADKPQIDEKTQAKIDESVYNEIDEFVFNMR